MLNHISIMGRICKDPELRTTGSGVSVCTFTVAVERDFSGKGEKITDFIECIAWRGTADFVSKYFSKGKMIVVDGSLQSRKWEDKNGNKRTAWEVLANNVYFADSNKETGDAGQQHFEEIEEDGDLPFER